MQPGGRPARLPGRPGRRPGPLSQTAATGTGREYTLMALPLRTLLRNSWSTPARDSTTLVKGSGYRQVGWGKSVSNMQLSTPTFSIMETSELASNQKQAYIWRRKYSDGFMDRRSMTDGAVSWT